MTKILTVTVFFSAILLFACSKQTSKEKLDAPEAIKDLISKYTDCTCYPYIDEYLWRGKTIYLSSCGGPFCDCMTSYYNENGEKFNMDTTYTPDNFRQESLFVKKIWSCKP